MDVDVLGTVVATLIKTESIFSQCFIDDNDEEEEFVICSMEELLKASQEKRKEDKPAKKFCKTNGKELKSVKKRRISKYTERAAQPLIPLEMLSDFKTQFKMTSTTFEKLAQALNHSNDLERKSGRPAVPFTKQLLIVVWMLVNQEPFRIISERFLVPKSTIESCFKRIIFLMDQVSPDIIKWPREESAVEEMLAFQEISGLSKVIGAIDNVHINIKSSRSLPEVYNNSKGLSTVVLQATCNHKMVFTSCSTKSPGSLTTEQVLANSELSKLTKNDSNIFPDGCYLVGSSNYPLRTWLITPYEGDQLTAEQEHLNNALIEAHKPIIKALKLLMARFQRLKMLDMNRLDLIPLCLKTACIIHNVCIVNEDLINVSDTDDDYNLYEHPLSTDIQGIEKRNFVADQLFNF